MTFLNVQKPLIDQRGEETRVLLKHTQYGLEAFKGSLSFTKTTPDITEVWPWGFELGAVTDIYV